MSCNLMQRNISLMCMKTVKDFPENQNVRNLPQKHADNGLQDDRPHVMDFTGPSRMKRESSSSGKSTTVPTSTSNPAVTLSKTNSQSTSTKEPNPTTPSSESPKSDSTTPSDSDPSTPDSDPITSDPESTNSTPDTSSSTSETPKPRAMITPAKSTTQKNRRSTPDQKSTTASLTATTVSPTTEPSTFDPETTTSSPTMTPNSKAPTITSTPDSKAPTTKPRITPSPEDPDTEPTSSSPTDKSATVKPKPETSSAPPTKKPTDSAKSTTATPLALRFNPDDESKEPNKIPESNQTPDQGPNTGNSMYPGFPSSQFPPFFMPSFVPDFSSPYSPSNPYFLPNAGNNNAWSDGGTGAATSFASASAGASAGSTNYNAPPLGYQGGYPDNLNTVNAPMAVEPTMGNVPNMFNAGGYGYGGAVPFDGGFAFPDFQRQLEENFRQMQASIQKQQQWLSDRIADGANNIPGTHSAVSSIQLGPGGGYQSGAINPAAPGVESRFANELPPPSGGSYGVFSSSSSHSMVGPDGKTVSHKSSTTGVNDNGKITFRTVED
ncbi:unnamed protein product [Heterotrigona itama]|uniref:Uncharacterized protein n=1 Tax=Heterotrigona itama TaxID=395501 RepID=A0A6V7HGW8_9HYME|nr:unnamed protein product [Heterotrigona itama]